MRAFIAFPLPAVALDHISNLISLLRGQSPSMRWVPLENIHITLAFIGETSRVHELIQGMEHAANSGDVIPIELQGIGTFPPKGVPRVVYARVTEGVEQMQRMRENLLDCIDNIASVDKRSFKPHITLARSKRRGSSYKPVDVANHGVLTEKVGFSLETVSLYESTLLSGGPRYRVVHTSELGANDKDI